MYFEKRWVAVPLRALTFNGTSDGVIKVATTQLLSVKQRITLRSNTQAPRVLQINRVVSATEIQVGELGEDIYKRADVSMFLVADSALLFAEEQLRPKIGPEDFNRAVYAEEPIVANRSILVDELGNYYNDANPIPVNASVSIGDISVDLDFDRDNPDDPNNSNTGAYIRDAAGNLITSSANGPKRELDVSDADAQAALASIDAKLASIDAGTPASLGQQTAVASQPVVIASDQPPIPVEMTFPDEPLKVSGTKDGTPTGPEFGFVNNERLQILDAHDREADFSYADFGTKNQRITQIDYTSATFPGVTVRRQFAYTLVGNNYRRDSEVWSVV